jgi:hypothetical protein
MTRNAYSISTFLMEYFQLIFMQTSCYNIPAKNSACLLKNNGTNIEGGMDVLMYRF